jgi:hypothetical protein
MTTLFRDIFYHLKSNNACRQPAKYFGQRTTDLLTHKYLTTQFIRRAGAELYFDIIIYKNKKN